MSELDKKIVAFIRRHHVLTLATEHDGQPWCSNLFYGWMGDRCCFVFTSDEPTKHICQAKENSRVGASIMLESKVVGRLQGLQIEGVVTKASDSPLEELARKAYIKRFPFAIVADLTLWILEPVTMKYTDNTLGFGKKIYWTQES